MILTLAILFGTIWACALISLPAVRMGWLRPSIADGALCCIAVAVALSPFLKAVGSFHWFMAPTFLLRPWLNWTLLVGFLLLVPLRNAFHLFRADAALEDYTVNALDLGLDFIHWVDMGGEGRRLRDVWIKLRLWQPPLFRAANIGSPITRGVMRPVVLLPIAWIPDQALDPRAKDLRVDLGLLSSHSPEDVFAAILHELAHHHGRDLHRAILKVAACMVIPIEWTFSDSDLERFGSVQHSWLSRAVHLGFTATRWPIQPIAQAAWQFQERRADAGATRFNDQAEARLNSLRGGKKGGPSSVGFQQGSILLSSIPAAFMVLVGAGGIALLPGRPLLAYSLGGDGAIRGIKPTQWSLTIRANEHGQRPRLLYLPPTRERSARTVYEADADQSPHDPSDDIAQAIYFFTEAFPAAPIQGPARFAITWDFWRRGPHTTFPIDPPVVVLFRPVESSLKGPDPSVTTYFSTDRPDYKLQNMGSGHFRASWTAEIPAGRTGDFFSIEWRAYTPGQVEFEAPRITGIPSTQN